MTTFEQKFFQKFSFDKNQLHTYHRNALRDLEIAEKDPFPEVRFTYAYQALIKLGICLIAFTGKVKVRSIPGHHVKILEKMGEILNDDDVQIIGNSMRHKRNLDLYAGGIPISEKEGVDYLAFVKNTFNKSKPVLKL